MSAMEGVKSIWSTGDSFEGIGAARGIAGVEGFSVRFGEGEATNGRVGVSRGGSVDSSVSKKFVSDA
jgi:hypothetical protein